MTEHVTPFSLDQIGSGPVRFSSKGVFDTHKDHMVDPYAETRMPKEAQVEGMKYWPQEKGRFPAVVLLHERWGLTSQAKDMAQQLACEGFVVLAPNLYGRQGGMVTANDEVATALMERLNQQQVLQDINASCEFLNSNISEDTTLEHTKRNAHAVVGFGMGGSLALQFACQRKRLRAAVAFYGSLPTPVDKLANAFCPIQYHAADTDEFVSSDEMAELDEISQQTEKEILIHRHPNTINGFCNDIRSDMYNAEARNKAWEEMITFLQKHLTA